MNGNINVNMATMMNDNISCRNTAVENQFIVDQLKAKELHINQLQIEIQKLQEQNTLLMSKNSALLEIVHEIRVHEWWNKVKAVDELINHIDSLLECPLTLNKLKDPVMTLSGRTIENNIAKTLIKCRKRDPFDSNKIMTTIIPNRIASQLLEIVDNFKEKLGMPVNDASFEWEFAKYLDEAYTFYQFDRDQDEFEDVKGSKISSAKESR